MTYTEKTFEEKLKEYARKIGINLIGITSAEPFPEAYGRMEKMQNLGYFSPWAEQDLQKRCDPKVLMKDAASIVAIGICYPAQVAGVSEQCENPLYGKLARFAQFQDYHSLLRAKLEQLVIFIREAYPEAKAEIYVDTGPLSDREVAYRAGLGFIGKNSTLIHPEYGSFIALGEILLNIPLRTDTPMENGCGECDLCLNACPAKAIKAPGAIHSRECLAHFTQEKGFLPVEIRRKLGNRLWGCDTCQDVCPYNRKAQVNSGEFENHALSAKPDLKKLLQMTNREYQELVKDTAMAWRGKTTLQRNALINLGNYRDPKTVQILAEALKDSRPVIRGTAAWAIAQIGGAEGLLLLHKALEREQDREVKQELETGLAKLSDEEE